MRSNGAFGSHRVCSPATKEYGVTFQARASSRDRSAEATWLKTRSKRFRASGCSLPYCTWAMSARSIATKRSVRVLTSSSLIDASAKASPRARMATASASEGPRSSAAPPSRPPSRVRNRAPVRAAAGPPSPATVAATPAAARDPGTPGTTDDPVAPVIDCTAARSATRISCASANRRSCSNASALSTNSTSGCGACTTRASEGAGRVAAWTSISLAVSPSCTERPERSENTTAPIAQRSVRASTLCQRPSACSGAM